MVTYNENKLKEAILIIAAIMQRGASKTKVAKALFYADFSRYKETRDAITGDRYINLPRGPAPSHFKSALDNLTAENAVEIRPAQYSRLIVVGLRNPDRSLFTEEEMSVLEGYARKIAPLTATDISRVSHGFEGWQRTKRGEYIHYGIIDVLSTADTEETESPRQYEPPDPIEKEAFSNPKFIKKVNKIIEESAHD